MVKFCPIWSPWKGAKTKKSDKKRGTERNRETYAERNYKGREWGKQIERDQKGKEREGEWKVLERKREKRQRGIIKTKREKYVKDRQKRQREKRQREREKRQRRRVRDKRKSKIKR